MDGVYIADESLLEDAREIDKFWIMDSFDDIKIIKEHRIILDFTLSLLYFWFCFLLTKTANIFLCFSLIF